MKLETKFNFGDKVTLVTDVEKRERIVVAMSARASNAITYGVMCGLEESWHTEYELELPKHSPRHEAGFKKTD